MDSFKREMLRKDMVHMLIKNGYIKNTRLIEAFLKVPRDEFVMPGFEEEAYTDKPLYIGLNQTISRPSIIGYILEQAEISPKHRVLEIGTGSGYQTALLAELCNEVFSIEQLPELAIAADKKLQKLGYDNIRIKIGDGRDGWVPYSPFNAIIVCASAENPVKKLIDQLSLFGRLIIPVETSESQKIIKITRHYHYFERVTLRDCSFVKLNKGENITCFDF